MNRASKMCGSKNADTEPFRVVATRCQSCNAD